MIPNVVFQEFSHKAADCSPGRGKALQHICALLILVQASQHTFELSDDQAGMVEVCGGRVRRAG